MLALCYAVYLLHRLVLYIMFSKFGGSSICFQKWCNASALPAQRVSTERNEIDTKLILDKKDLNTLKLSNSSDMLITAMGW